MQVNIANHSSTIIWDGIYYFALSDYPQISLWELKKLLAFINYEKQHGRHTEIVCEDKTILSFVSNAIAHPETVINAPLPEKITECTYCKQKGFLTQFLCHTATIKNAKKILIDGKLLSAVRALNKTADTLVSNKRNAAGDPMDFFNYIMFTWGNCQAGDQLVMERNLGRFPNENDLTKNFTPGVRFYFQYEGIIKHPGYVSDGYHPAKVKDELVLANYLYACIIPEQNQNEFKNLIQPEIADKTYYLPQDKLGLLDWSKKVYDFIERISS